MTFLKALKISGLLSLVIAIMRLASWVLNWLFERVIRVSGRTAAVAANVTCFAIYIIWRYEDSRSVGGIDWSEIIFGAVVWGTCLIFDLTRARRRASSASTAT